MNARTSTRRFTSFAGVALVCCWAVALAVPTPLHAADAPEPDGCSTVRRLLRLHLHTDAVAAAGRVEGRRGVRCHIPADVFETASRTQPNVMLTAPTPYRPAALPLVDGRRIHHLISTTAGAMLVGAMVAGADRVTDEGEVLDMALGYGVASLAFNWALSGHGGMTDRKVAAAHSGFMWGTLAGAILNAEWQPQNPNLPPWFRDDDPAFSGAIAGSLSLGPLFGAVLSMTEVSYDGISQLNSAMSYGLMTGWLATSATFYADPNDAQPVLIMSMLGGLLSGGLWRLAQPLPRWRTTLADLGAIGGTLLGSGLTLLVLGDSTTPANGAVGGLVGMWVGVIGATWMSPKLARWLRPESNQSITWRAPQPTILRLGETTAGGFILGFEF